MKSSNVVAKTGRFVGSNLNDLSLYSERLVKNLDSDLSIKIDGLTQMILLMNYRLTQLEEWKSQMGGQMDIIDSTSDNPKFTNQSFNNLSGVTMLSDRIKTIEQNVAFLGQTVKTLANEIPILEANISINYRNAVNLANFSQTIYGDIVRIRKRVHNLEQAEITRLESDRTAQGIAIAKGTGKVLISLVEWIPLLGDFFKSYADFVEGTANIVLTGAQIYETLEKYKVFDAVQGASDMAKMLNKFVSEGADDDPTIGDLMSGTFMISHMEAMNFVKSVYVRAPTLAQPVMSYYLRPIIQSSSTIVAISKKIQQVVKDFNIQTIVNQIPSHGYIDVVFPMGNNRRRQLVISVGAITWSLTDLPDINDNFIEYVDRIQEFDGKKWNKIYIINNSLKADINDFEEGIENSTLMEAYNLGISFDFAKEFILCMKEKDASYNTFNHNCQHMSREIINFLYNGLEPHWWDKQCSFKHALAELSRTHSSSPFGSLPKTSYSEVNHFSGNLFTDLVNARIANTNASVLIREKLSSLLVLLNVTG